MLCRPRAAFLLFALALAVGDLHAQQGGSPTSRLPYQSKFKRQAISPDSLKQRAQNYARQQFPVFRSKLLNVSSLSVTAEAYSAQRTGQPPTGIPSSYLRLIPDAQFAIAGLPFNLTGVSSSEQSLYRQPLNRFNLQFDAAAWKQAQQAFLEQRIADLEQEINARALDELDSLAALPVKEGERHLAPLNEKKQRGQRKLAPKRVELPVDTSVGSAADPFGQPRLKPQLIDPNAYKKGDNARRTLDGIADRDPERMARYQQLKRLRAALREGASSGPRFKLQHLGIGNANYAENRLFAAGVPVNGLHVGVANQDMEIKVGAGVLLQERVFPVSSFRRDAALLKVNRRLSNQSSLSVHYLFGRDWPGQPLPGLSFSLLPVDTARFLKPMSNQVAGLVYATTDKTGTYTVSAFGSSSAAFWLGPYGNLAGTSLSEVEKPIAGMAGSLAWKKGFKKISLGAEAFHISPGYFTMGHQFLRTNWQGLITSASIKAARRGVIVVSPQHFRSIKPVQGYQQRVSQLVANATYQLAKPWIISMQGLASHADEGRTKTTTRLLSPELAWSSKVRKSQLTITSGISLIHNRKQAEILNQENQYALYKGGIKLQVQGFTGGLTGGRILTTAVSRLAGERMPEGVGQFLEAEGSCNIKRISCKATHGQKLFANGSHISQSRFQIDYSNNRWLRTGLGLERIQAQVPIASFQELALTARFSVAVF